MTLLSVSAAFTDETPESVGANCSRPSVENFPAGVFDRATLQRGALAVDVAVVVYLFGALAIVCDSYFMPALEVICSGIGNGGGGFEGGVNALSVTCRSPTLSPIYT